MKGVYSNRRLARRVAWTRYFRHRPFSWRQAWIKAGRFAKDAPPPMPEKPPKWLEQECDSP